MFHLTNPSARDSGRSPPYEGRAAAQVWRLVSGYAPGKRENRFMVVLVDPQLVADASGNDPLSPFFVFGGFIAPAAQWAAFSEDWQTALDLPPKLDYFKMTQAANMSGEFDPDKGWTEQKRDDRIITLARIIRHHASVRVSAWIRRSDYDTHIMSLPVPRRHLGIDSPYVMLVNQLVMAIAVMGDQHGIMSPCDYIFDTEQGFDEEIFVAWPNIKWLLQMSARSDIAQFVGERPIYRDDKTFLPLQAADLYAWQVRNFITENNKVPNQTIRVPANRTLRVFDGMGQINREYSTDEVVRLREFLLVQGQKFIEANPNVRLLSPYTDPKERRLAYKRDRKARKANEKKPSS
jgi:hypothetical protein